MSLLIPVCGNLALICLEMLVLRNADTWLYDKKAVANMSTKSDDIFCVHMKRTDDRLVMNLFR